MPVQPDTRRLAVVADLASYLTSTAFTALRGAANGLATLDGTGAVPAAQLPIGIGGFLAGKPTATSRASTITQAADPHLTLTLPTGLYRVEIMADFTGTGPRGGLVASGGGAVTDVGLPTRITSAGSGQNTVGLTNTLTLQATGTNHLIGTVRMTTAGVLAVQWTQSASSATATVLGAGAWLRADRISA
jgi:hypothetical protein